MDPAYAALPSEMRPSAPKMFQRRLVFSLWLFFDQFRDVVGDLFNEYPPLHFVWDRRHEVTAFEIQIASAPHYCSGKLFLYVLILVFTLQTI